MKPEYIIASIVGLAGIVYYCIQDKIARKLEDYFIILLASAGIVGGIKIICLALYRKKLIDVSSDTRYYIFIGGVGIFLISLKAGMNVFGVDLDLY